MFVPHPLIVALFSAEDEGFYGVKRYSLQGMLTAVEWACELGIPAVALFPVVDRSLKTANGDEALNDNNFLCQDNLILGFKPLSLLLILGVDSANLGFIIDALFL